MPRLKANLYTAGRIGVMELVSIMQARLVALVQLQEWDPFGRTLTLEALAKLGSRFSFAKVPSKLEELDPQRGIELLEGKFENIRIDKIVVYLNGIAVDTRSSTEDSERVLSEILVMAHEAFGATIRPARQSFLSQFMFRSNMRLAALNPVLPKIAEVLSTEASANLKHPFIFEPTAILFNVDTSQIKIAPSLCSIERRAEIPFAENTYFSNAPLRTAQHIEIVKAIESSLLS